jgi:hypothetical protein
MAEGAAGPVVVTTTMAAAAAADMRQGLCETRDGQLRHQLLKCVWPPGKMA